jgi:tetraacyldisaccharide 4'-kinase
VIRRHARRWLEELPASSARLLLAPAWVPYRLAVAVRNLAYDRGLFASHPLPVPVISLGNLTAGGTGKTPAALAVVERLRRAGRHPAILSRGYRGVDGVNEEARLAGDTPVVCDPNRLAGGQRAIAAGADCLVLDDGFQHRRLRRDLDIVLIDATRPWGDAGGGRGAVLPLGYLREGRRGLARADLLWITRADLVTPTRLAQLQRELSPFGPVVEERATGFALTPLATPAAAGAIHATPAPRAVLLVSGIGNPAGFEAAALRAGLNVLESHRFPDHHHYTAAEADWLLARAAACGAELVTTSKDAVKLAVFTSQGWVLSVSSALVDPTALDEALARVLQLPQSPGPAGQGAAG